MKRVAWAFASAAIILSMAGRTAAQDAGPPPPPAPPIATTATPTVVRASPIPDIVNARWLRRAMPEFPEGALARGVAFGHVRLECIAGLDSLLTQCRILEESPAGEGFGQAALTGSTRALVEPRTINGVPEASRVTFNVDFRLAE